MTNSLRAVAEAAGVSLSTASRVFTNAANVSEEIRGRVLAASTQLAYRHRERGRKQEQDILRTVVLFVRSHNRFTLSWMLGDFYGYVLQGIETECRRQRLTMQFVHDDSRTLGAQLADLDVDDETGILLMGPFTAEDVADVQRRQLPVVLINNVIEQMVDAIVPNYYAGAQLAVRHLLAAGHRRIAYLHGRERYTTRLRLDGYRAALEEAGIAYDPALVAHCSMSAQSANEAVTQLLGSGIDFTALFCVNDISAFGAITALSAAGRRPGTDVSLIGFDDIDLSMLTNVPLTTVHVPKLEMGAVAIHRLQERAEDPEGPIQQIILGIRLVERGSVQHVRGQGTGS